MFRDIEKATESSSHVDRSKQTFLHALKLHGYMYKIVLEVYLCKYGSSSLRYALGTKYDDGKCVDYKTQTQA